MAPTAAARPGARPRPTWERPFAWLLVAVDGTALTAALLVAIAAGIRPLDGDLTWMAYDDVALDIAMFVGWIVSLAVSRTYDPKVLGFGSEEYRNVGRAAARWIVVSAAAAFAADLPVRLSYLLVVHGLTSVLVLVGRRIARRALHRRRITGHYTRRILAVGATGPVDAFVADLRSVPFAGLDVVGSLAPAKATLRAEEVVRALDAENADVVALVDSESLERDEVRRLAWLLEGSGVDLLVVPAVTDVAGPRIVVRPVGTLPLLYVEEPELQGSARFAKRLVDVVGAVVIGVVTTPVALVVALAVKATSPGPVLFSQERAGRGGRSFTMLKVRTMEVDAPRPPAPERESVLFKLPDDPRVTRVGRFLRRHSLDELPQLWNVLRGEMSLVGPRPPLQGEVDRYPTDMQRRLVVRPGMTGLWQVSGRSDLSWDETVRLDLYYVDNWSLALDATILWRTIGIVIRGDGAY